MKFSNFFKYFIAILIIVFISHQLYLSYHANQLLECKKQVSPKLCREIGEMLIVGFGGVKDPNGLAFKRNSQIAKDIKNYHVGGVILFSHPIRNRKTTEFLRDRNIQSPAQVAKLNSALQAYMTEVHPKSLPLFIAIDQEGGLVDRLTTDLGFKQNTLLPQAFGAAEERVYSQPQPKRQALEQTYQYAENMAQELAAYHFNLNFAPLVDVNINPLNSIIGGKGRSFSVNPEIVADQAWEFINAFHHNHILSTLKHFPGHGSSAKDSHIGLVDVTETYQKEKELLPYRILINKGFQDVIMTTHVINGQLDKAQCKSGNPTDRNTWCPGTMSYVTLTKVLREQLGFKGIIVSDDMTMGAISKEYPLDIALEKAINAGVDMFIIANHMDDSTATVINTIAKLVKENRVNADKIHQAYQHITGIKLRLT